MVDRRRCVVCAYPLDLKLEHAVMHEYCADRLALFDPPPPVLERQPRIAPRFPVPPPRRFS